MATCAAAGEAPPVRACRAGSIRGARAGAPLPRPPTRPRRARAAPAPSPPRRRRYAVEVVVCDLRGEDRRDPLERERTRRTRDGTTCPRTIGCRSTSRACTAAISAARSGSAAASSVEPAGLRSRPHQDGLVAWCSAASNASAKAGRGSVRHVGEELAVQSPDRPRPPGAATTGRAPAGTAACRRRAGSPGRRSRSRGSAPAARCAASAAASARLEVQGAGEPRGSRTRACTRPSRKSSGMSVMRSMPAARRRCQTLAVQATAAADDPVRRLGGGAVAQNSQPYGLEAMRPRLDVGRRRLARARAATRHACRHVGQQRRRLGVHVARWKKCRQSMPSSPRT